MAQISSNYGGWLIVVAVGSSAVVIGAVADFFVKKNEIKWLHGKFLKLSEALTKIPLRDWQVKIAKTGIKTVELAHKFGISFALFPNDLLKGVLKRLSFLNDENRSSIAVTFCYFTVLFTVNIIVLSIIPIAYRLAIVFFVSVLFFLLCVYCLNRALSFVSQSCALCNGGIGWLTIFNILEFKMEVIDWFFPLIVFYFLIMVLFFLKPSSKNVNTLINAFLLSVIVTALAFTVAYYFIDTPLQMSYWYYTMLYSWIPNCISRSILLYCSNYFFDLVTIVVSILLLRFVIKHRRFIGVIAVVDVVISALLTVLLYSFLLMIENNWDILHLHFYFADSLQWFKDVIVSIYQAAKYNEPWAKHLTGLQDTRLLPVLLTTFVPVALYMSVFVLISFCKPVLRLASRIFGAVGEREESVFKQFGFLIAAIMAALKAIYEVLTL